MKKKITQKSLLVWKQMFVKYIFNKMKKNQFDLFFDLG